MLLLMLLLKYLSNLSKISKIRKSDTLKLTRNINAISYKNGENIQKSEEIVYDEATNLKINNNHTYNFSSINNSLEDFATGYMIGEGIIENLEEIKKIKINGMNIDVEIDNYNEKKDLVLPSDSAGGWRSKINSISPIKSDLKVEKDELLLNIEKLRKNAEIWQKTGGTHVAAFVNNDKNQFIVREDVSRHVAVDKVIGAAIRKKLDFSNSYIIYSGRMPADMVIKIVRSGIPLLASNAAPSFSGYSVAEKGNVTLVGFIREDRFNVYTHWNRVIF